VPVEHGSETPLTFFADSRGRCRFGRRMETGDAGVNPPPGAVARCVEQHPVRRCRSRVDPPVRLIPQQWWGTISLSAADYRPLSIARPEPIEQVFAKLKHLLRKCAARTVEAICAAIGPLLHAPHPGGMRQLRTRSDPPRAP